MVHKLKLPFPFVLCMITLVSHVVSDVCNICDCQLSQKNIDCTSRGLTSVPRLIPPSVEYLYLQGNQITVIERGAFENLNNLTVLSLEGNVIRKLEVGSFENLSSLKTLFLDKNNITAIKGGTFRNLYRLESIYLHENQIKSVEKGSFQDLTNLKILFLYGNQIKSIEKRSFENLINLETLSFKSNRIQKYEDGAFLFLTKLSSIDLSGNSDLICGCHLPAFVNYLNISYNRIVDVKGECRTDLKNSKSKVIPILEYSQCENYSLFPRNLRCQTCSGVTCNDPEETNCTGSELVCESKISMNDVKLKFEKSCSSYRKCLDAMKGNTCHKWTRGTCTACCIGNVCNENDFIGWSNFFVFYLIYNSTLKEINEYIKFAEKMSRAMQQELSNLTGEFEIDFCGLEANYEIFRIHYSVPDNVTKHEVSKQILEAFNTSQTLRNLSIQERDMKLTDEMVCSESTTSTNNFTFYWPMTKVGINATTRCDADVATRYCSSRKAGDEETGQYQTSPKCSPFTGVWQEPDMSQCYNLKGLTKKLQSIQNENIDKENVEDVSMKILDISEKSVYFKEEDIELAVNIQEKMLPLISNMSANITVNNILLSINNMMNTPEAVLVEAEQSERTAKRMLAIIETIPDKIPVKEQQLTVVYTNLGIGVIKVNVATFNGAFYGVSYGNNETEAKTMIYNHSNTDKQGTDMVNYISLPKSLFKHREEHSTISRISFFSMKDDKLYRVIQKSRAEASTNINSHVISANIPNIRITNLDEPVNIFNFIDQYDTKPQCVFWDGSPGQKPNWSTTGCKTSGYVPGEKAFCSCNHLTSFALKTDIKQNTENSNNSNNLHLYSNVGCGISFAFLVLTVIIHVCFKNLRELTPSKILIRLCISLAVSNFIFFVGMQPYATRITTACKAVAALIHYFLIASLMWMTAEVCHICRAEVHTSRHTYAIIGTILAWGLPAVIVAITLGINYTNNYIRIEQVCWLSKIPFYAAFLTPVMIILIFNIFIFFLNAGRLMSLENTEERNARKIRILGIVGVFFLFSLTWILAFFSFDETNEVFTFLFAIFNTLQGLFIFLFYCIYMKDGRRSNAIEDVTAKKDSPVDNKRNATRAEPNHYES